jgi:maltose phosphorylase
LSPCVHSIIAAKIGRKEKAYEMYLRTARLDLDDYNHEADEGLHITSMAGTWMSVIYGFGGMRVEENALHFNPYLPKEWDGFSFKIKYRKALLNIQITRKTIEISNNANVGANLVVKGEEIHLEPNGKITLTNN